MHWEGAAREKATGDPVALSATAARFEKQFKDSSWARKASVWAT